jgi:hypothetical protein
MRDANPGSNAERRAHVRYSHTLRSSCRTLGKEAGAWTASVQNVSRAGVALVMDREVGRGSVLVVSLEGLGGRFSRPVLVRAMNVRPCGDGRWHVGCSFVKALTDSEVEALLLVPAQEQGEDDIKTMPIGLLRRMRDQGGGV